MNVPLVVTRHNPEGSGVDTLYSISFLVPLSSADSTSIISDGPNFVLKGIKVSDGIILTDNGINLTFQPPQWTQWFPTWGNGDPSLNFGTPGITDTSCRYRKTYDMIEFVIDLQWSPSANASIATINLPNNDVPTSFFSTAQPIYCAEIIHDPRTGGTARLFGSVSLNFVGGQWNMVLETSQTGEAGLARQASVRGIYRVN